MFVKTSAWKHLFATLYNIYPEKKGWTNKLGRREINCQKRRETIQRLMRTSKKEETIELFRRKKKKNKFGKTEIIERVKEEHLEKCIDK